MAPRLIRQLPFAGHIARAMRAPRLPVSAMGLQGITPKPLAGLAARIRALGPYAAMGLLLPGGSLIALFVWAMRHRAWTAIQRRRMLIVVTILSGMLIYPTGV